MSEIDNIRRRRFLKATAATVGGLSLQGLIEKALAITPNPTDTPSLADIEHVIVFMQENRSFDHYFGMLPGVRGYGDPRPAPLPSGNYVWYQPEGLNPGSRGFNEYILHDHWLPSSNWYQPDRATQSASHVLPFRLNQSGNVQYQYLPGLDHSWKVSQDLWRNWDAWVPLKSRQSMGGLGADDLPFYYQLANAFTVCDDYHCSVFGATDPNRFYLWSGTCPPPMKFPDHYSSCGYSADIQCDINSDIGPAMYGQTAAARHAAVAAGIADWKTWAETLTDNGITWKVYQEDDNYGDNYLQYFKNFRIDNDGTPIDRSPDAYFQSLYQRGRVFAKAFGEPGDALVAAFANDVAAGMEPDAPESGSVKPGLPRVSWIVAPYRFCERPSASPGDGEAFTAKLLNVLVSDHPEVFRKTALLLTYDENDGYFDHVPPPIPAIDARFGQMTLADAGTAENFDGVPVGLGPRVPMLVISPWTTGGKVCSQPCDHTSVLRFLEQWIEAKRLGTGNTEAGDNRCHLISDWRRAVCGDLTDVFDFGSVPRIALDNRTYFRNGTEPAAVPHPQTFPVQDPLVRPACRFDRAFSVDVQANAEGHSLHFANTGTAGVALIAYWKPMSGDQQPFHYTIEAGKSLRAAPLVSVSAGGFYDWAVYGPNGFLQEFRGNLPAPSGQAPKVAITPRVWRGDLLIRLDNRKSARACLFLLCDNAYYKNAPTQVRVEAGAEKTVEWGTCAGWYDASVRVDDDEAFFRRVAGCVQHRLRQPGTDPAIGNARLFKAGFSVQGKTGDNLRFDYAVPPWHHRSKNWLGVFPAGVKPVGANLLQRVDASRGVGSVKLANALPRGRYDAWYFFDDSYTTLTEQAVSFEL